jgi:hypothetical protein
MNINVKLIEDELKKYNNIPEGNNKTYYTTASKGQKLIEHIYKKKLRNYKLQLLLDDCDKKVIYEKIERLKKLGYLKKGEMNMVTVNVTEYELKYYEYSITLSMEYIKDNYNVSELILHEFLTKIKNEILEKINNIGINYVNKNSPEYHKLKMKFLKENHRIHEIDIPFYPNITAFSTDINKLIYFRINGVIEEVSPSFAPTIKISYNLDIPDDKFLFICDN